MVITSDDIDNLKNWMESIIDQKLALESGQTLDDRFTEKLKFLPTKDEFYGETDKLMKKLNKMEEEITIASDLTRRVNNHQTVLEKIGRKLQIPISA